MEQHGLDSTRSNVLLRYYDNDTYVFLPTKNKHVRLRHVSESPAIHRDLFRSSCQLKITWS